jgi:arylsulfatase A-like enzyme
MARTASGIGRSANHRSVKQLMGLSGGVSRAKTRPHTFDSDQLYDLNADPEEMTNIAAHPENRGRLREMKQMLKQELDRFPNRPFGEFIPGGNAVPGREQTDLAPLLKRIADKMN